MVPRKQVSKPPPPQPAVHSGRTVPGGSRRGAGADPWLWALALCALPLVLHARSTPLGEPFADDFSFLERALLPGPHTLFDGGGSPLFWRPLSRQVYFGALGPFMLAHPALIAALQLLVLLASGAFVYRALRPEWPGPWCAAAASVPLLLESDRMLIAWPSHYQDVGALFFGSIALHEASRRRGGSMALALACSLLCKEVVAAGALLLPWIPAAAAGDRKARIRSSMWTAAVLAAWGAAYLGVAARTGGSIGYAQATTVPLAQRLA